MEGNATQPQCVKESGVWQELDTERCVSVFLVLLYRLATLLPAESGSTEGEMRKGNKYSVDFYETR